MANAKFIGWQTVPGGFKIQPFPLFTVTKPGHRLEGSTVTESMLWTEGIVAPTYPTLEEWHLATSDLLEACKAVLPQHLGKEHGERLARAIDKAEGRTI